MHQDPASDQHLTTTPPSGSLHLDSGPPELPGKSYNEVLKKGIKALALGAILTVSAGVIYGIKKIVPRGTYVSALSPLPADL
jgi:hypothetical protein